MSDSEKFEQKWKTASESHKSLNVLRKAVYSAYNKSYEFARTVAFGMLSLENQCESAGDFLKALGRCNDANTLEEVLEWLKMNKME